MPKVFVSRPTYIPEDFQRGLDGFLGMLTDLDLFPKTIGTNVYPTESPLQAVIDLMDECFGAVILGYPHIIVTEGLVKEEKVAGVLLPTEWNHIEAGLAIARGKPLLVIHHEGVGRGIFDRGAINKFIYEKDLSDPAWALDEATRGAVGSWKHHIESRSNSSTTDTEPQDEPISEVDGSFGVRPVSITDDEVTLLEFIASVDSSYVVERWLRESYSVPRAKLDFLINELIDKGLLRASYNYFYDGYPRYYLTQDGRKKLVEMDLL